MGLVSYGGDRLCGIVYNWNMPKQKASRKGEGPNVDLDRAEEAAESGLFVEKEDLLILYHALDAYKPSEKEKQLHGILLEQFEEILISDFSGIPPQVT